MELHSPIPGTRLESAELIPGGSGCMGDSAAYWRATAWDSTGQCMLACATSLEGGMEEAEKKAIALLERREHFLRQSVETKLEWLEKKMLAGEDLGVSDEELLKYVVQGLVQTLKQITKIDKDWKLKS